jgi:hypothetical protein
VKNVKAKLAAVATVVALGGFTGLALSQGGNAPTKAVADKPAVHTKVIRRTIHVTKHAKPKHPPASAPVVPAAASASGSSVTTGSSGSGESVPVTTSSSGSGESPPVTTSSSGSGGGEYEDEGDDDHGESGESGDDHGGEHEGGDD